MPRSEKKSETLELRLEHQRKQAFMQACRERGVTASDAVRDYIDRFVSEPAPPSSQRSLMREIAHMTYSHKFKLTAMAMGVAAMAIITQPQGHAIADDEAFHRLDTNKDGRLTPGEIHADDAMMFEAMDTNGDGAITRDEFVTNSEIVRVETFEDENGVRREERHVFMFKVAEGDEAEALMGGKDMDAYIDKLMKEAGEGEMAETRNIIIIRKNGETTSTSADN